MLTALSPLDGRYAEKVDTLRPFFSEYALIEYRVRVEVEWFRHLAARKDIPHFSKLTTAEEKLLTNILNTFSKADAERVKEIESVTNHDVKAVEYFLKKKIADTSLAAQSEWIHFALTSEDVNNLAYALMVADSLKKVMIPEWKKVYELLLSCAQKWKSVPMLARTHGQPASPTTMGKEFLIFASRLERQIHFAEQQKILGKVAGASGNFNAHAIAFPEADWLDISESFVTRLGLTWNPVVPQIEPHDFLAEVSHFSSRIGTLLIDFSRDSWAYISLNFFGQTIKAGEVGSSAMPHKVNPIDFENAEGNFGMANALFSFFAEKLPLSRWQRDLTDSTVLRNLGVAFGHHFLALKNIQKGIEKLELNEKEIRNDLQNHPEILAEAAQTVMRKNGVKNPYEKLKEMTRGKKMTMTSYQNFINALDLPTAEKARLKNLSPETYLGLAMGIVEEFGKKKW